ncbi:GspH/FimT family pseudopilin [Desulfuromonas acetoxidans]|uniref:Type II secretion system protein H n=1 Tax=Desulfuromonas acetoxidans (strain DSM 684 / 11070) TaxID=281689 RepID=Q1JVH7_DESA6|nr:GspH/FimT family pseudopilin [Desulfuromonas acetoxidans]EAT14245.1 conserved hypothetical protein [Desulfuromonas acetoxidans DSM 684]MBF0645806.1 GspH/FimT family pseudopilin [Desulfuromonas acetoxidans]NVD24806.1 GspH/FimT family pseudopilin [Desulfuromonas acetoxidans]NVE16851.1 GspH/FimT family pseudopilin [Desulfuromonas acetoxidans]
MSKEDQKGFTLLEVVVVIAMLTILTAIAGFYLVGRAQRASLKKDANDIAHYMVLAKTGAIRDTTVWAIQFDPAGRQYVVLSNSGEDAGSEDWTDGDEVVYQRVRLSAKINFGSGKGLRPGATVLPIDGVSFSADRVVFNPNGTSESGTVYLKNDENETFAMSSLATTGRVKVWKNYGSGWD